MAKRVLGAISLLMGAAILGWLAYNLIWPTHAFRAGYRSLYQAIVPLAMVWYGWQWLTDGGPGIESLQFGHDEPELSASVEAARRTMPVFLAAVRKHEDGTYIKFPLLTDTGVTEHIWAYVHHYADGVFNVSLANNPYTQKGDIATRRDVPEADVEDWQIMNPDGRIQGGHSLRALFAIVKRKGLHLNRTMRKQLAQFLDAAEVEGGSAINE